MAEIEKAREALVPALRHRFLASGWLSDDADRLAGDDTKKFEAFVRAIAREEIEAAAGAAEPEAGDLVTLAGCSPGVFITEDGKCYGLKTEYGMTIDGTVTAWPDAYVLDSGEIFWGGASTHFERANVLVREVHFPPIVNQEGGEAHSPGRHERPATGLDKSPPAVEAPAAGEPSLHEDVCSHAKKLAREIHEDVMAGEDEIAAAIEAGFRYREQRLTALARRVAEALRDLSPWVVSTPVSTRTKALEALAEARKRGLIE